MDYTDAMKAAGADVLAYQRFGSYQGDWWAKVAYEGRVFWVAGSYGSCSGCDQMEGMESDHYGWRTEGPAVEGHIATDEYGGCSITEPRWAELGRTILSNPLTQAEAEKEAAVPDDGYEYDKEEADKIRAFIAGNAVPA